MDNGYSNHIFFFFLAFFHPCFLSRLLTCLLFLFVLFCNAFLSVTYNWETTRAASTASFTLSLFFLVWTTCPVSIFQRMNSVHFLTKIEQILAFEWLNISYNLPEPELHRPPWTSICKGNWGEPFFACNFQEVHLDFIRSQLFRCVLASL